MCPRVGDDLNRDVRRRDIALKHKELIAHHRKAAYLATEAL
jgi:hypothetical protein